MAIQELSRLTRLIPDEFVYLNLVKFTFTPLNMGATFYRLGSGVLGR